MSDTTALPVLDTDQHYYEPVDAFTRHRPRELREILLQREPLPGCYRDRDARLRKLDEQGIQAIWLLPSIGMGYEEGLQYDVPAAGQAFGAFNRWLLEDWGLDYAGRIFSAPYLAMGDVDTAVGEVDFGLGNGARLFVVRAQAVYTAGGWLRDPRAERKIMWENAAKLTKVA
jgi:hypothetical protein